MLVLNASGCLDALAAPSVARTLDAFVTKTVTPRPREGNVPVRVTEVDVGMLNSIGLANPGIDAFLADALPRLRRLEMPIWVSVGGSSRADFARLCRALDGRDEVSAIELNLSCPNVEPVEDTIYDVVHAAREETAKPLYAKLSPAVTDIGALAAAAEDAGADGLSVVNTVRGLALDERTLAPRLGSAVGGLSGPALKPVALAAVFTCRQATELPIVGMGGVATGRDALELVAAGASAVALGTVLFSDPGAPARIRVELAAELRARELTLEQAFGAAHARANPLPVLESSFAKKHLQSAMNGSV